MGKLTLGRGPSKNGIREEPAYTIRSNQREERGKRKRENATEWPRNGRPLKTGVKAPDTVAGEKIEWEPFNVTADHTGGKPPSASGKLKDSEHFFAGILLAEG